MKAYIGPYKDHWSVYTLASKLKHLGFSEATCDNLAYKLDKYSWIEKLERWFNRKFRERKIVVKIDSYDSWDVDDTLRHVTLPILKQLKATKQGSGLVDLEDVPEHLRFTAHEQFDQQLTFGFYHDLEPSVKCDLHTRYEWVLDEIIWAFEQLGTDWGEQYWLKKPKLDFAEHPEDVDKELKPVRWLDKGVCDWEGLRKHGERIQRGLELFGKYYQTLWD